MARYLSMLCLGGLALASDFGHGQLTRRQDPAGYTPSATTTATATVSTIVPVACASPGVNYLVNSDFVNPNSPGSVNYTVECGSDTLGTNLYDAGQQAPNGYLQCITICEASPDCQAFQFVADSADGTGSSSGNCYLKQTSCEQGVAFDRVGQDSAAYVAGLRPGPAPGPAGTTTSGSATQTTRACAASATPTNSPSNTTNVYYVQCDIDTEGGLLSVIGDQVDYNACFPLCDSTPSCVGFTFTRYEGSSCNGYCYLKFSDPPSSGLRFTTDGLQGTNLVAALMQAYYLPPVVSSTVATTTTTTTSTPGPPPIYSPPAVPTTTTTTSTTASTSSSLVPSSSLCPGSNGTTVTDDSANTYILYCGFEYQGQSDLFANAPNMQACIDACGARPASPAPGNCLGVSFTGGDGSGQCYLKTTGLYLTPAPGIICAVRNVPPPAFTTTVTSTTMTSPSTDAPVPPAYTPPDEFTTTTTTSSSSSVQAPPVQPTTTTTTSSSSSEVITSSPSSSSEVAPSPPIYTPPVEIATTSSSSSEVITSSSSSSSEVAPSPPIYIPPVEIPTTSSSSSGVITSSSSSSSEVAPSPPIYTPPIEVTTTISSSIELTASSSSPLLELSSSPGVGTTTTVSISSSELPVSIPVSSSEVPLSPSAFTPPTIAPQSSTPFSSSTSSATATLPPAYTPPVSIAIPESSTPASSSIAPVPPFYTPPVSVPQPSTPSGSLTAPLPPADETTSISIIPSLNSPTSQEVTLTVTPIPSPTSSILFTSSARPPTVTDIPRCAQPCVLDFGDCAAGDVRCICSNQPLLETYRQCVVRVCTLADAEAVVEYATDLCGDYGVTALPLLNYPPEKSAISTPASSTTSPPSVTDIPTCAQPCVSPDYGDCAAGDVKCICSNQPLLSTYRTCVIQNCNAASAQDTYNFAVELCGNYGVTSLPPLIYPSTTSTTRTTALPSSTTMHPPSVTDIPLCAQHCILGYGTCSATDVKCICSSTALLEDYRTCIVQSCNAPDAQACYDYASQLCGQFGVTSLPPLYPSSTSVRSPSPHSTGTASVTALPTQQSCIPCTRSTGSCVKRTTVMPVYTREL